MKPLLELRDVFVLRDRRCVLEIERLMVEQNSVLSVVGPNGAGKSTLLLLMAGLIRPTRGQLFFKGRLWEKEPARVYRRRLGLVMQTPLLFDTTVFENVAAGLHFRGISRHEIKIRVDNWLNKFGIYPLKDRRARQISGGEAQRVSLARAFVLEPELLLLDEPFSALDPPTRSRLLDELEMIIDELRVTTIFVTHDLNEASRFAQTMAVMLDGQIRQIGTPEEVFKKPIDNHVFLFLQS